VSQCHLASRSTAGARCATALCESGVLTVGPRRIFGTVRLATTVHSLGTRSTRWRTAPSLALTPCRRRLHASMARAWKWTRLEVVYQRTCVIASASIQTPSTCASTVCARRRRIRPAVWTGRRAMPFACQSTSSDCLRVCVLPRQQVVHCCTRLSHLQSCPLPRCACGCERQHMFEYHFAPWHIACILLATFVRLYLHVHHRVRRNTF
jgi:hypothetical protein